MAVRVLPRIEPEELVLLAEGLRCPVVLPENLRKPLQGQGVGRGCGDSPACQPRLQAFPVGPFVLETGLGEYHLHAPHRAAACCRSDVFISQPLLPRPCGHPLLGDDNRAILHDGKLACKPHAAGSLALLETSSPAFRGRADFHPALMAASLASAGIVEEDPR